MIGRIGATDDVGGQAAFPLVPRKGLERRGGQHPAKIPDHRIDHSRRPLKTLGERLTRNARRRQREAELGGAGWSRYFCGMKLARLSIATMALLSTTPALAIVG